MKRIFPILFAILANAHCQSLNILSVGGSLCSTFNASCTSSTLDSLRSTIENRTNAMAANGSTVDTSRGVSVDNPLVDKLSEQIRLILKHFQQPEPLGIPGQNFISEPIYAPETNGSLGLATAYFHNITIWGLSNFTLDSIETKLDDMEIFVALRLKRIIIEGNYSVDSLLSSSSGPFNITLKNVTGMGTVDLEIAQDGKIYANRSITDMTYDSLEVILEDVSSILLPFVSTCGVAVLESEKPHILGNVNERVIDEINKRLSDLPKIPPLVKISPVDLAVLEGRKFVRSRYEPFTIANVFNFENPFLKAYIGPVTVYGLSKFGRVGNITLLMKNSTVVFGVRLFTGPITGQCKWSYDFGASVGLKRLGQSNFTAEHVQIEATIHQSVDTRKSPKLEDLQVETGAITIKMDGNGKFDYLVEMGSKMLPKMLRYVITDALEEPVRQKLQTELLNKINVHDFIEQNMPDIEKFIIDKL